MGAIYMHLGKNIELFFSFPPKEFKLRFRQVFWLTVFVKNTFPSCKSYADSGISFSPFLLFKNWEENGLQLRG